MKKLLLVLLAFASAGAQADITLEQYQKTIAGTYCIKVDGDYISDIKFQIVTSLDSPACKVVSMNGENLMQSSCLTQSHPYTYGPISMPTTSILLTEGENGEETWGYHFSLSAFRPQEGKDIFEPMYLYGMLSTQDHTNNVSGLVNLSKKKLFKLNEKTNHCDLEVKAL